MAPELFNQGKDYLAAPVDVWACGVVLYAMSTGHFPFAANTERDVRNRIKRGIYHIPSDYPAALNQILQKMLTLNPQHRAKP